MVRVFKRGLMAQPMWDSFYTIYHMEKVLKRSLMEESMTVTGLKVNHMALGF